MMTNHEPAQPTDKYETIREALDDRTWTLVSRRLLAKMLAEFAYEEIIDPTQETNRGEYDRYRLSCDEVEYRFLAKRRVFDSYRVDPTSVERRGADTDGWTAATDPVQFLLDARTTIGIGQGTASHLIREYNNTLVADAHIAARKSNVDDRSILDLPYGEVEGEMEGHPWFTISKGRDRLRLRGLPPVRAGAEGHADRRVGRRAP